jgi:hypothetical protein
VQEAAEGDRKNAWGSEGVFANAIQKFTRTPLKESSQKLELTNFRIAPE